MTKQFRDFLKEHNAYYAYIKNNKGESENPYTYIDSFHWDSTPEGYEYWRNLDDLWFDILEEEDKYDL